MTSRNLFFKLMKEDFKIRIWTLAISILAFFFSIVVATAMIISYHREVDYIYPVEEASEMVNGSKETVTELARNFLWYMNADNALFKFIFVCLALVMAMSGFAYLYSKKKVDMYHSLPVRRETLFAVKIINGILIVIVPFIICALISSLMVVVSTSDLRVFSNIAVAVIELSLLFIMNYSIAVLAIMLTGNMLIGILAFIFFSFYFPMCSFMLMGYQSAFFGTYYHGGQFLEKILPNVSGIMITFNPFHLSELNKVIISFAASILFMALNLFLYKKRASETAGKSISFGIIKLPIKFMMVVFMCMSMYILTYEMMIDSTVWGIFGAVIGGIITHCIMEIIYNQDFKKIFHKKIEMLICIILSFFFIASFQMDLFGYDRYIPKTADIKETAVITYFLESNAEEYHRVPDFSNGYYGDIYECDSYPSYSNVESELIKKMNIGDKDAVVKLANLCVASIHSSHSSDMTAGRVLISYKLKSGRSVQRKYDNVELESMIPELSAVYDDEMYKKSMYPILSESSENIVSIDYDGISDSDRHIKVSETKLSDRLLETYKKELSGLKYETKLKSHPFASIRFNDEIMEKRLNSYVGDYDKKLGISLSDDVPDSVYINAMTDRGYYPVFPEFKETIAVLKEMGVDVIKTLPVDDVDRIEVSCYKPDEDYSVDNAHYDSYPSETDKTEIDKKIFRNTEDIEKILDSLVFCDSAYVENLNEDDHIEVFIYLKSDKENAYGMPTAYYFKKGSIPDIVNIKY